MFKKFFGKKNDGFYMQVDESAPPKTESPKADKSKSQDIVAKTEAAPSKESVATQLSATLAEPIAAIDPVAKDQSEPKAKSAKTSIKKEKKAEEPTTGGASEAIAVSKAISPEPVAPAFTNFATDYLVTPAVAGNRRRPGANMKGFVSMAKDVKEMKKGSQANQQKQKAAKRTEA
jgi:hypothetical protein